MAYEHDRKAALLPDAGEPLVLVGPPRALRGEFRVRNPGEEKLIVRQPTVRPAPPQKKGAAALPQRDHVLRRIVVRPGQWRDVPFSLTLPHDTAPGTYEARLQVEGEERDIVIHVTEEVAISIDPSEVVVPGRPGERVRKRVVFTNHGNVPQTVKSIGTVVLDEELVHCRALRGALEDVGDTMEGIDDFIAALGRRYKKLYETLVLRVQNDAIELAPGETKAVDLKITLPDKLDPRARYGGYAAIATSSLTFIVVPD